MTFKIQSNEQLKSRARHATGYEKSEVSESQMSSIVNDAKFKVYVKTGSEDWFTDNGLTLALYAYLCMRLKASVENIKFESYELGGESAEIKNASPDDSQQIRQWMDDVREGLQDSDVDTTSKDMSMSNSTGYIGESSLPNDYFYK